MQLQRVAATECRSSRIAANLRQHLESQHGVTLLQIRRCNIVAVLHCFYNVVLRFLRRMFVSVLQQCNNLAAATLMQYRCQDHPAGKRVLSPHTFTHTRTRTTHSSVPANSPRCLSDIADAALSVNCERGALRQVAATSRDDSPTGPLCTALKQMRNPDVDEQKGLEEVQRVLSTSAGWEPALHEKAPNTGQRGRKSEGV